MTDATHILKEKNLKVTRARVLVLDTLAKTGKPCSVQKLVEKLQKESINFSTVYRTLATLSAAGLVREVHINSSQGFYELEHAHPHHHLVCTTCEDIEEVDVENDEIQKSILKKSKRFSQVRTKSIELFGTCNSCKK